VFNRIFSSSTLDNNIIYLACKSLALDVYNQPNASLIKLFLESKVIKQRMAQCRVSDVQKMNVIELLEGENPKENHSPVFEDLIQFD
jgi:hypothetical protein